MSNDSLSDYRRALLTSFSILVSILTSVYYVVVNWFVNFNPSLHFYYIYIAVALVAFLLNRTGRHRAAKIIFLSCINLVVFAFASREPEVSAAFLFFIAGSLIPLAIFDAKEKKYAFSFVAFSIALYLIARFTSFSLVPSRPIDPDYLVRAYNNNFLIVYTLSILTVYFLVTINFSVEASLRQRENQIVEKNRILTKTNEELDRFIYSTSHDLRAPINSIQGLINLSERATDPEDIQKYHELMRGRLSKLEQVLNDIMHYSKNAKLDIEKVEVNVLEIVQPALSDIKYIEGTSRIRINVNIPETLTMLTDPMRFRVIVNNLISNACKYSDPGKENSFIEISARKEAVKIIFSVKDNGEGIVQEHQEKVFLMFHRATSRSTGSGLGLYLVKEVVERLGGTITLTSQYGVGSEFIITLPSE